MLRSSSSCSSLDRSPLSVAARSAAAQPAAALRTSLSFGSRKGLLLRHLCLLRRHLCLERRHRLWCRRRLLLRRLGHKPLSNGSTSCVGCVGALAALETGNVHAMHHARMSEPPAPAPKSRQVRTGRTNTTRLDPPLVLGFLANMIAPSSGVAATGFVLSVASSFDDPTHADVRLHVRLSAPPGEDPGPAAGPSGQGEPPPSGSGESRAIQVQKRRHQPRRSTHAATTRTQCSWHRRASTRSSRWEGGHAYRHTQAQLHESVRMGAMHGRMLLPRFTTRPVAPRRGASARTAAGSCPMSYRAAAVAAASRLR
jgi:hypothetical protein